MDILSSIKDYVSYASIVADSKEFLPKSISERALGLGEAAYLKTVSQGKISTGKAAFAAFA